MASVEATAVPAGVAFVTVGSASPALVAVLASLVLASALPSLGAVCAIVGVVAGVVTSSAEATPPAKKKAAMTALASP